MQRMRGITAIGVIVMLIFFGVLGYVFLQRFLEPSTEESKVKIKEDLQNLTSALDQYRLDNGNYPTTEQGLKALVEEPTSQPIPRFWKQDGYILSIPLDPWGRSYQYINNYEVIRVYSYGSKGKDGNTEINLKDVSQ